MGTQKPTEQAGTLTLRTWKDFPPLNLSLGNMRPNLTGSWRYLKLLYEDKVPACQNACPAGNDIEGWIKLIQKGHIEDAYWHLKREEPFPAVLGRACFRFCEPACNRAPFDHCVGIQALERYIGDHGSPLGHHPDLSDLHVQTPAVVGSGPGGMSAAYHARMLGFRVTVFEKEEQMGGLLRLGIPAYCHGLRSQRHRLPPGAGRNRTGRHGRLQLLQIPGLATGQPGTLPSKKSRRKHGDGLLTIFKKRRPRKKIFCRRAVQSKVFHVYEVENGRCRINVMPQPEIPVADYLRDQGRFKQMPPAMIAAMQADVDRRWKALRAEADTASLSLSGATRFPVGGLRSVVGAWGNCG